MSVVPSSASAPSTSSMAAMTIGALVAFNMLAGRVSGPLGADGDDDPRISGCRAVGPDAGRDHERASGAIWPRARAFARRLPVEISNSTTSPSATRWMAQPALDDVSFTIPAGSVFGIVGKSGSGKTTITRLIQGLYQRAAGPGADRRVSTAARLTLCICSTSIGVVLQDNFLFHGTVRDNIAAAKPEATFDQIAEAARMAGAEEFIERLPRGYDTMLEENAVQSLGWAESRGSPLR
jgi:subfamily B ATP-binding cassette protein HlyB/CyaB